MTTLTQTGSTQQIKHFPLPLGSHLVMICNTEYQWVMVEILSYHELKNLKTCSMPTKVNNFNFKKIIV